VDGLQNQGPAQIRNPQSDGYFKTSFEAVEDNKTKHTLTLEGEWPYLEDFIRDRNPIQIIENIGSQHESNWLKIDLNGKQEEGHAAIEINTQRPSIRTLASILRSLKKGLIMAALPISISISNKKETLKILAKITNKPKTTQRKTIKATYKGNQLELLATNEGISNMFPSDLREAALQLLEAGEMHIQQAE
jgi:hypothetical protein